MSRRSDELEENISHMLSLKCSHFFLGGKPRFGGDWWELTILGIDIESWHAATLRE
jgi:hypothetical protein